MSVAKYFSFKYFSPTLFSLKLLSSVQPFYLKKLNKKRIFNSDICEIAQLYFFTLYLL